MKNGAPRPSLGRSSSGFLALNTTALEAKKTKAPQGRVTLVFTDVQDSTKLWEADQEAMSLAVKSHHACMRSGIKKFQGFEVKTEGDAFMVAFSSSRDAVKWCLHMQEALINIDYPMSLLLQASARLEKDKFGTVIWRGLRVRMGIHTGFPESSLDPVTGRMDYYGPMVNLAARISGQAKGGRILLSKDTFDEIRHDLRSLGLPTVTDAGLVDLKGISKSVRLYAMVPDRLSQRSFEAEDDPAAQVEYLQGLTNELNRDLENLDPDAQMLNDASPLRQQDLHVQPVMLDMSWVRPKLGKGSDWERHSALELALQGVLGSSAQAQLDRSVFTASDDEILETAFSTIKTSAANIYDILRSIVTSIPTETAASLQKFYTSSLDELQTIVQSLKISEERLEMIRDSREDTDEQVTKLDAQLANVESELKIYKNEDYAAPMVEDIGVKDEAEVTVVMAQIQDTNTLHAKMPRVFTQSVDVMKNLVARLLNKYNGERCNHGIEHVAPIGHGKDDAPTEWERPSWCSETEYLLAFQKPEDALNFCLQLQLTAPEQDWPRDLLKEPGCREEGTWRGLRMRMFIHNGAVPPPIVSPAGIRWYTGSALQKCSRGLATTRGGEIAVTAKYWSMIRMSPQYAKISSDITASQDGKIWKLFHLSQSEREDECMPFKGRFLDVRFWISGAPALPSDKEQIGYLTHELRMRDLKEEEVLHAVDEILMAKAAESAVKIKRTWALVEATERQLMAMHDDSQEAKSAVEEPPTLLAITSPKLSTITTIPELLTPPKTPMMKRKIPKKRIKILSMLSRLTAPSPSVRPSRSPMMQPFMLSVPMPPVLSRDAFDIKWAHSNVRYFLSLLKKFLMPRDALSDKVTEDQLKKLYAKRALSDQTRREQPFREQFNAVAELVMDVEDDDPMMVNADAARVAESITGMMAKMFSTVKEWKRLAQVESNKEDLKGKAKLAPISGEASPRRATRAATLTTSGTIAAAAAAKRGSKPSPRRPSAARALAPIARISPGGAELLSPDESPTGSFTLPLPLSPESDERLAGTPVSILRKSNTRFLEEPI
eukprot:TRINITY_DN10508_c0_g1_i1.p1 TRINITY_DN10508_c0_g1~~TRINITY_DN10508_c0_g1_i1.p1  ORF type:complete len:1058 (+),score=307.32 TRINITY_DN10508_c0_g1_i1:652-3825(+)